MVSNRTGKLDWGGLGASVLRTGAVWELEIKYLFGLEWVRYNFDVGLVRVFHHSQAEVKGHLNPST
jgi:hypothetical protein